MAALTNELKPAGTNREVSMELASDYGGIAGSSSQSSFPVLRFIEFPDQMNSFRFYWCLFYIIIGN